MATKETTSITQRLNIQEGDVFANSWGYDQTNIDYYQVVKVTASTVTLRAIRSTLLRSDGYGSDVVGPALDDFYPDGDYRASQNGRKTVREWGGEAYVSVRCGSCHRVPVYETARATSSGWGH